MPKFYVPVIVFTHGIMEVDSDTAVDALKSADMAALHNPDGKVPDNFTMRQTFWMIDAKPGRISDLLKQTGK